MDDESLNLTLDQHFLEAKNVLLLEQKFGNINSNDIILEIGAGDGRFSEILLQAKPKRLISFEMDERFKEKLLEIKNKYENFEFEIGNAIDLIDKLNFKFNKIISNIPYSITEPLYKIILDKRVEFVLLLHGINFYYKIQDENSKWHYFVNAFYDFEMLKEIPGNAFNPPAKTMSVLIKLDLKKEENLSKFDRIIRLLYDRKDRSLKNALIFSFVEIKNISKKSAKEIVNNFNLDENILNKKLINLSNKEFIEIINKLKDFF